MGAGEVWQGEAVEPSGFLAAALQLAADPGPLGSTAGNGVWEHPGSETHVGSCWGGGHVRPVLGGMPLAFLVHSGSYSTMVLVAYWMLLLMN